MFSLMRTRIHPVGDICEGEFQAVVAMRVNLCAPETRCIPPDGPFTAGFSTPSSICHPLPSSRSDAVELKGTLMVNWI